MKFEVITFPGWNVSGIGQHVTELAFSLRGPKGAMVWRMATGIAPTGPWGEGDTLYQVNFNPPSDMGLTFHAELTPETALDEDYKLHEKCEHLEGRACSASYLTGMKGALFFRAFACEGFDGVRKILEREYEEYTG